ncbi:hypothetical protein OG730_43730 (plasmid) [Streptomyces sp. NBC_01298]|uniref:hypothetical protein n=1 Tax=Streptomyces sp. NBC_01298 TaxID=2903817 RepID=UPI002E13D4A6|nr:hypothetical protein OG730_43730 [Streptomyces sp. NBC_01298]
MNLSDQNGSASSRAADKEPRYANRRRLTRVGAIAVLLVASTAVACSNRNDDSADAAPATSSPASNWPGNGDPATEAFRTHLARSEAGKELLAISMHVMTEEAGPPLAIRIVTNLDRELRDSDSPDVPKAVKIAKAFADWHTDEFKDHGTVKIGNPATEVMATVSW